MRGLEDTNRIQRLQMNNNSRDLKTHILKELIIFELWGKGETRGQVRAFALACPK
jgi:hypothetical protein